MRSPALEPLRDLGATADPSVLTQYERNVSGLTRKIAAVVTPRDTAQVQAIVREANRLRTPLYPVSTGANWGLGSKLPVQDGGVVVDLSRMREIQSVDERHGHAVIQPGVTQGQLYRHLVASGSLYYLNVTGSGAETSILGNALDRGIAHHGPRVDEVLGLEVVLGNGDLITTGSAGRAGCRTDYLYRHGLGPSLDGLFFQSSCGIVTRAGVRLRRRRPLHAVLRCAVHEERRLPELVDSTRELMQLGILEPSLHLANFERAWSVLGGLLSQQLPPGQVTAALERASLAPWSLSCPLSGTASQVRAAFAVARRRLRWIGIPALVTQRSQQRQRARARLRLALTGDPIPLALCDAARPAFEHSVGVPSDAALASVCWPLEDNSYAPGTNLDATRSGTLFILPVLPMDGESVEEVRRMTAEVFKRHGFAPYMTLNSASPASLEAVINVLFRRGDAQHAARAHRCAEELISAFSRAGYLLYRAGIQSMPGVAQPGSAYWDAARRLKAALDPNGIIAPGRYGL